MRKRYTEEEVIAVLKEAKGGVSIVKLGRKHGISDATFYIQLQRKPSG